MFEAMHRALSETEDGWFLIEKAELKGENVILTAALYQLRITKWY